MRPAEPSPGSFARCVHDLVSRNATALAMRWLEMMQAQRKESPERVFPTQSLLDHIPELLRRIAHATSYDDSVLEQRFIRDELADLARLRRSQGYGPSEILDEFDQLTDYVLRFVELHAGDALTEAPVGEVMHVVNRLRRALDRMGMITLEIYRAETSSEYRERHRLLSDFGRAITHELRNRLNTARLALDAYREAPEGPGRENVLDALEAAIGHSTGVVADVLSVVIARGDGDPIDVPRVSLQELLTAVVDQMRFLADERDVSLSTHVQAPDVLVEPVHVQLVLTNLISNAIKYSDPAKPERFVAIEVRKVRSLVWRVDVRDNGVGVAPAERDRIFHRSVRGERTCGQPGQGLGLDIARKAVRNLGGDLWLESSSRSGSCFCFTLVGPSESLPHDD